MLLVLSPSYLLPLRESSRTTWFSYTYVGSHTIDPQGRDVEQAHCGTTPIRSVGQGAAVSFRPEAAEAVRVHGIQRTQ